MPSTTRPCSAAALVGRRHHTRARTVVTEVVDEQHFVEQMRWSAIEHTAMDIESSTLT